MLHIDIVKSIKLVRVPGRGNDRGAAGFGSRLASDRRTHPGDRETEGASDLEDRQDEADALLARIMMLRDDLKAGRLTLEQVRAYRGLGRMVERFTRDMDAAADQDAADALWRQGADLIVAYLAEHFPVPTCH